MKKKQQQQQISFEKERLPNETTRLLQNSLVVARETEEISDQTHEEMIYQRKKLEETRDQLDNMTGMTEEAKEELIALQSRYYQKKFYLWLIIIGLFFIIMIMLFALIVNNGRFTSSKN